MKKAFAFALLPLLSACAGQDAALPMSSAQVIPGAMNAPTVLRAQQIEQASAKTRRNASKPTVKVDKWGTRVDYDHTIYRPDLLSQARQNGETARPTFATLKRTFGEGDFRPYVGVGVGQASAQFDGVDPGAEEAYAVKGVVGGNMLFSDEVGAYVQYEHAIASENSNLIEDDKSHGISFGLSISLN